MNKSRMTSGLFSSRSEEWSTPQYVFDALDNEFHFGVDVCATKENAKANVFFTKEENGLLQDWCLQKVCGACFCNPPYGKTVGLWMNKTDAAQSRS